MKSITQNPLEVKSPRLNIFERMAVLKAQREAERLISPPEKPSSYFSQRLAKNKERVKSLILSKKAIEGELKRIYNPGWWREHIKPKAFYQLPKSEGEEEVIAQVRERLKVGGEWVLRTIWGRIPQRCLWEFALEGTRSWAAHPNLVYFVKFLDTIARLYKDFPEEEVWNRVKGMLHRYAWMVRWKLIELLRRAWAQINRSLFPFRLGRSYFPSQELKLLGAEREVQLKSGLYCLNEVGVSPIP